MGRLEMVIFISFAEANQMRMVVRSGVIDAFIGAKSGQSPPIERNRWFEIASRQNDVVITAISSLDDSYLSSLMFDGELGKMANCVAGLRHLDLNRSAQLLRLSRSDHQVARLCRARIVHELADRPIGINDRATCTIRREHGQGLKGPTAIRRGR